MTITTDFLKLLFNKFKFFLIIYIAYNPLINL